MVHSNERPRARGRKVKVDDVLETRFAVLLSLNSRGHQHNDSPEWPFWCNQPPLDLNRLILTLSWQISLPLCFLATLWRAWRAMIRQWWSRACDIKAKIATTTIRSTPKMIEDFQASPGQSVPSPVVFIVVGAAAPDHAMIQTKGTIVWKRPHSPSSRAKLWWTNRSESNTRRWIVASRNQPTNALWSSDPSLSNSDRSMCLLTVGVNRVVPSTFVSNSEQPLDIL